VLVAGALFALAISNAVYEATSPGWFTFHVLLRKSYSVFAFALVGFAYVRTLQAWGRGTQLFGTALVVGLYSALIELGQRWFAGAREPFSSQAFDIACGFVGGALGLLISRALERLRTR